MSKPTLEQKVASALAAADVTSAALGQLVAETEAAIIAADKTAEEERAKALDPALSPDPKAAREAMQAAEFTKDRLKTVLPRLRARWQEIAMAESLAAWRRDFDAVEIERDETVDELRKVYPATVATLVDLMVRIAAIDKKVDYVNGNAPPGAHDRLHKVERAARGQLLQPDVSIPLELRLPHLDRNGGPINAWPPQQVVDVSLFAPVPYNRAFSADWHAAAEERDRRMREEAARLDAYYEQREREAEKRREAELREAQGQQFG